MDGTTPHQLQSIKVQCDHPEKVQKNFRIQGQLHNL